MLYDIYGDKWEERQVLHCDALLDAHIYDRLGQHGIYGVN